MKLKKFFKKIINDDPFANAGQGQRLCDSTSEVSEPNYTNNYTPSPRPIDSELVNKAAQSALERLDKKNNPKKPEVRNSMVDEIKAEKERLKQMVGPKVVADVEYKDAADHVSILFCCPTLFGDSVVGSYKQIEEEITNYLNNAAQESPDEAVALMLIRGIEHSRLPENINAVDPDAPSLSEIKRKRKENLIRILQNLADNPNNPKFKRLRLKNAIIQDVLSIESCDKYLEACGFQKMLLPSNEQTPEEKEEFLVIPEGYEQNEERVKAMLDLLKNGVPIISQLYRNTKLYSFSQVNQVTVTKEDLPDEYFTVSKDELKQMISSYQRIVEESGVLMTKATREKIADRQSRFYRYVLIRVRFSNNYILQGTFHANDKISVLKEWVANCLSSPTIEFTLFAPPGSIKLPNHPISSRIEMNDDNATLVQFGLAPCSLIFVELKNNNVNFLKSELLACAAPLT